MAAPTNTTPPTVAGTPTVGHVVRSTPGVWTEVGHISFAYQWQRDVGGNLVFSNIGGATSATYTLVSADNGNRVRCNVTDTDSGGSATASSDTMFVSASRSITWTPTNRQDWEQDTIFLFDPDQEQTFWTNPGINSILDASGTFTSQAACNPWRGGTPWVITAGKFRRGIQGLVGGNQWLWLPGPMLPTDQFTVEFWVQNSAAWNTVGGNLLSICSNTDLQDGVASMMSIRDHGADGNKPSLHVKLADGTTWQINGSSVPAAAQWVHLAVTYDGSTVTFYIDGTSAGTHALTAPLIWTGDDKQIGGLAILEDASHGLGAGTGWVLSDLRISRVCRIPATPVTVASANSITFTDTPTGVAANTNLRAGVHDFGSNSTTLTIADTFGMKLARVDKLDSALPIVAGGTDASHPTAGHSGLYAYDFRPADHLFTYLQARGMGAYLGFGSCPQILGGSVAPLNSTQCADTTVLGGNATVWAPEVPSSLSNNAAICSDIYYYVRNTYPGVPISFVGYANEPDGGGSDWAGTTTQMFDAYKAVVNAIRAINGSQKVGGLEIADYNGQKNTWIQAFITYCGANAVPLDYISFHAYTGDIGLVKRAQADVAVWAAAASIATPGICLGEFGWNAFNTKGVAWPWAANNNWVNDWGAAFLAACLIAHQAAGTLATCFFSLKPVANTDTGFNSTGLLDATKPWASGNVERMMNSIGAASMLTVSAKSLESGVLAMAAKAGNIVSILVTNLKARQDRTTDLTITLPSSVSTVTPTYRLIDSGHSDAWDSSPDDGSLQTVTAPVPSAGAVTITMNPRSVHLLTFAPAGGGGSGGDVNDLQLLLSMKVA